MSADEEWPVSTPLTDLAFEYAEAVARSLPEDDIEVLERGLAMSYLSFMAEAFGLAVTETASADALRRMLDKADQARERREG